MSFPNGLIQAAYLARYRGDAPLAGLLGNPANPPGAIFDANGPPANTSFPYVILYQIETTVGTTLAMGQDAVDTYMQVSVFTSAGGASGGMKQARDIIARIYDLTHTRPVDLLAQGFAQFFALFQNGQELPPKEGDVVAQIVHRYKLMTQTL